VMEKFIEFLQAEIEKYDPSDKSGRKFAAAIKLSEDTVNRMIRRKSPPSIATLIKIAKFTHNDIKYLIGLIAPEAVIDNRTQFSDRARFLAETYDELPPEFRKILDASI